MLPMAQPTQPAEHAHTGSVREATYQKLIAYSKATCRLHGRDHLPTELRFVVMN
jgi:hypothetical protein